MLAKREHKSQVLYVKLLKLFSDPVLWFVITFVTRLNFLHFTRSSTTQQCVQLMAVNECGYTISFLTWSRSSVRMGEGKGGNWAAGMSLAPALVCSSCTLTLRGFCYFDFLSSLTLLQMKSGRREGNFTDDLLPLLGLWTEGNGRISQLVCPFDSFLCWPSSYEWLFSCRHQLPGRFLLLLTGFRKKRSTYHASVATLPFCPHTCPSALFSFPWFKLEGSSCSHGRRLVLQFLSDVTSSERTQLGSMSVDLVSVSITSLLLPIALPAFGYFCACPPSPSGTCTHRRIEPISWLVQQCMPSANFFCKELDSK